MFKNFQSLKEFWSFVTNVLATTKKLLGPAPLSLETLPFSPFFVFIKDTWQLNFKLSYFLQSPILCLPSLCNITTTGPILSLVYYYFFLILKWHNNEWLGRLLAKSRWQHDTLWSGLSRLRVSVHFNWVSLVKMA